MKYDLLKEFGSIIMKEKLNENVKEKLLGNLLKLKKEKVNLMVTGATGCGKSSTGSDVGGALGGIFGGIGETIGSTLGSVVGGVVGGTVGAIGSAVSNVCDAIGSFFSGWF